MRNVFTKLGSVVSLGIGALSLGATGCGAQTSSYMRVVQPPAPIVASPDAATVVFIRGHYAWGVRAVPIVKDDGEYLGELNGDAHLVAKVAPGHHLFSGWLPGREDGVAANLAAGRIYFVRVGITETLSGGTKFTAIAPRTPDWSERTDLLAKTRSFERNDVSVNAMVADRRKGWLERIHRVQARLAAYTGEEQAAHQLRETDGVATVNAQ